MTAQERFGWEACMRAIYARERLDFINDVSANFSEDGKRHKRALADIAFADDPIAHVTYIEALTRG